MTLPIIVVLEDQIARVEWLEKTFPDSEVRHSASVTKFLELQKEAEQSGRLVLSILDHDLGMDQFKDEGDIIEAISTSEDSEGYTGLDAAKKMMTFKPVIVWSANTPAQIQMLAVLRDRGIQACIIPIYDQGSLKRVIGQLIKDAEEK